MQLLDKHPLPAQPANNHCVNPGSWTKDPVTRSLIFHLILELWFEKFWAWYKSSISTGSADSGFYETDLTVAVAANLSTLCVIKAQCMMCPCFVICLWCMRKCCLTNTNLMDFLWFSLWLCLRWRLHKALETTRLLTGYACTVLTPAANGRPQCNLLWGGEAAAASSEPWAVGHTIDCIKELERVSVTSSIENDLLLEWSLFSRPFISLCQSGGFFSSCSQQALSMWITATSRWLGPAPIYSQWVTHINSARK